MKRILVLLFVVFSFLTANAQETSIKDVVKYHKCLMKQAESFADEHEWVSFKIRNLHYYDDKLSWDEEFEVIIKYDGKKSIVYYNMPSIEESYYLDNNTYKRIERQDGSLIEYKNTIFDFDMHYKALGKYGFIPRYFSNIPYYIHPIDFASSFYLNQIFNGMDVSEIDGELHNVYKYDSKEKTIRLFVNAATNIMDSAYYEEYKYLSKDYYTFYDFSYEDRQDYIDSLFNFNNKEYEKYTKYDLANLEPYWSSDTVVTDKLLDFPLVDLKNDTTTLREQEGWILLNLWTLNCEPCMEQFDKYSLEKDFLGYRVLENEGVKIMAIEHHSNNMEYIEKVAKKYDCEDIIYSGKELYSVINLPYYGYYYLISPEKKVVYRNAKLGDYEEIINKLKM